jgi:hypothetical protein
VKNPNIYKIIFEILKERCGEKEAIRTIKESILYREKLLKEAAFKRKQKESAGGSNLN